MTLMDPLYFLLVAACRSVNTVLQKQLTEEKDSKEAILRHRDQLSQVRNMTFLLKSLFLLHLTVLFPSCRIDNLLKSERGTVGGVLIV